MKPVAGIAPRAIPPTATVRSASTFRLARFGVGASVAVLAAITSAPGANAQEADSDAYVIIVSATLREETLQDAPISVGIATSEALERNGVTTVLDLPRAAPSLSIAKGPSTLGTSVNIRGLGSASGSGSFESSVGFYIDGSYIPRTRDFASALFDIERVEVVRGAQSSLLGKNASLGAVNLVTQTPGNGFEANASLTREFELESLTATGGVSVPLTDTLSVRLAGIYDQQGGWVENLVTGNQGGGGERKAGRLTVAWTPTSDFDATFRYEKQDIQVEGYTTEFFSATPGAAAGLAALAGFPGFEANFDRRNFDTDSRVPEGYVDGADVDRASLTAHWNIGDFVLTSQTSMSSSSGEMAGGPDGLPGDYFLVTYDTDTSSASQEFRLASPADDRFRYVTGAWLGSNEFEQAARWYFDYPTTPPGSSAFLTYFDQTTESWSAFAQADYDLTDRLTLSGGLRYTDEQKDVDLAREVITPGFMSTIAFPPYAPFALSRSEGSTDGLVNLSYKVFDDLMIYAAWAQGTKSGGFADAATFLDQSAYDAEVAQTSELGVRYQSADRQITANATLFKTDVADFQLVTFNGVGFVIGNTDLESVGLESELIWRPDFAPAFSLVWNNTYAEANNADTGADIPLAPLWSGGVSASYEHGIGDNLQLVLNAGADYQSGVTYQQNPAAPPAAEPIEQYSLSVALEWSQGYAIRLFGRNLTDANRHTFAFPGPFLPPGNYVATSERPRTIGLELSYRH